jgi:ATP-dependent DNA helicase RecQ
VDDAETALFAALRRHRLDVARAHRVPPYVVASDRSLHEMAALVPRTLAELAAVFGFGPGRTEKYGAGFLAVLAAPPDPGAAP